jgi:hypothetical protein
VLLIHVEDSEEPRAAPVNFASVMEAVDRFDQDLTATGQNVGSVRLMPATGARTVRVRNESGW